MSNKIYDCSILLAWCSEGKALEGLEGLVLVLISMHRCVWIHMVWRPFRVYGKVW